MRRALVLSGLLAFAPVAILSASQAIAQDNSQKCADTAEKKAKRSMFGSILGSIGGSVLGRAGVGSTVYSLAMPAASYLGDELLKLLDCKELQQAATATDQAIKGGVGTEVKWTSESRANVSGSSKVTAQQASVDGGTCLTVTDVVIVDGQETTVPKKMCRAPGQSAYVKV
jgi:hypothetical protein